jgi:hypothetical protein
MAKVYLSSTVLDLETERGAVTRWLIGAGHLPVHSYVADGDPPAHAQRRGHDFWDSAFRLLVDGVPRAPDSSLNELVSGNAAKEAEISFQVPRSARGLVLRVIHHESVGDIADLPLRVASREPAAPPAGQSVTTGDIGAGARVNIQQRQ